MKIVKIIRIDDWLDVVYADSTYLNFQGHSVDEANDLYRKFLSQEENTTKWISVKDRLPDTDCMVYVVNNRGGEGAFVCMYQKHYNVFKLYDPKLYNHPCVDATHWYPLPDSYVPNE